MKNQLPTPPASPEGPTGWGYRSRYIETERRAGYVAFDIPVYRMRFWGKRNGQDLYLPQTAPVAVYSLVLN
jgi:hypothetical protein